MITFQKNGLKWFEFENLIPFKSLTHGTLSRKGGFSKPPFDSLNLNLDLKEMRPDILKNLTKVKEILDINHIVWSKQVHETTIIEITLQNINEPFECDGFVTNEKDIALLIKHADCQAALFFDPHKNVIGAAHAGWRGQVSNIYKKMIDKMDLLYGCNPKDILVSISPSLGPDHAEFKNYKEELPKSFWPFQIKRHFFDLWAITKDQLLKEGVLNKHIEIAEIDTYQNKEDFFSFRREKVTGRNATFIALK